MSFARYVCAVSTFRASIRGRGLLVPPRISSRSRSSSRRPRKSGAPVPRSCRGTQRGAKCVGQRRRSSGADQLRDLMGNLHDKAHIVRTVRRAGRSHADYGHGATVSRYRLASLVALSKRFLTARATSPSRPGSVIGDLPALTIATCGLRLERTRSRATRRPLVLLATFASVAGELLGARTQDHSRRQAHTLVSSVENSFRFPQGSVAEISSNGRHMRVGATRGPHLRFVFSPHSPIFFATLAH
jgi:hypothetical protein